MNSETLDFYVCDSSFFDSYCFICGEPISDFGINLFDARTTFTGLQLPDKLGDVIGNKYIIVVSKEDKVCTSCNNLINHLDELEYNLRNTKKRVIQLLEFTHKLDSISDKDFASGNDFICSQNLENSVSPSSPRKTFDDVSTYNIGEIESISLISERSIETNFRSESHNDNNLALTIKDFHENKEPPISDSASVLGTNSKDENCETNAAVYDLDHIIEDSLQENDLASKQDNLSTDHNINNYYTNVETEITIDNTSEHDVAFGVKAEQVNVHCFPQLVLSLSEVTDTNEENLTYKIVPEEVSIKQNDDKLTTSTKEKIFVCEICDIPFSKPYLLTRHTRIHQRNSEKVKCPTCNLECHDHLHYLYHRKNEHDILKRLSCPLCNEIFMSNKELRNHILTSHEGEQFSCDKCGEKFKRLIQFENHKLYSHGNRNCRICGKHISSVVKLRQHENRHAWIDSKKLSCDVCGRIFKTPGGLRVHKVSHTGNYKYFCEFCGRGFMSAVILEEHKGVHTKEERYVCDICGRKFVLYSTFHLHKQWHKDPFPFPCNICKKKFRYRSVRSTHIRRDHTGENPYKCHYCDAEFLKSVTLKKHISTHTKVYPFNCNNCLKGFDQRRSLARHMARIHHDKSLLNEGPKKCQYKVILRPDEFPTDC